ncbi:MAG: DUF1540 domain-containing protein [Eubacterium sp.]|nr:DUF1540 domain-containing protein [Eubacterium sp.]
MTKLNCNVKNCYFNKELQCCLEGIKVGGESATVEDATFCGSFKERLDGQTAKACHCDGSPEKTLKVGCNAAKCVFNDNQMCHAKKITIQGNGAKHESQTMCGSFKCD